LLRFARNDISTLNPEEPNYLRRQKMNKILTISILLTIVVSSGAFAAPARWNALGGEHRFIIDTSNYPIYPGRVQQFGNALFVIPVPKGDIREFYNERYFEDSGVVSGALLNVTENMTLAFHYNLASAGAKNLSSALAKFAGQNNRLSTLDIKTFPDLFWGMKMGNISLGARLAMAMDSSSDATTTVEEEIKEDKLTVATETKAVEQTTSAKALDLSLGATMYKTPVGDLDLGLCIGMQNFTDEGLIYDPEEEKFLPTSAEIKSTGGLDIAFNARLHKPLGNYTLIPVLNLNVGSLPSSEYEEKAAPNVTEVSYTKGDIGIGFRDEIKEKGTLIAGAVCGYDAATSKPTTTLEIEKTDEKGNPILDEEGNPILEKEKKEWEETTDTTLKATILAGYEFPITKWLIGRGGVNVKFAATTDEVVVQEKTESMKEGEKPVIEELVKDKKSTGVGYYYNMGFRIVFHGLITDVLLARNIVHRGPYFLTGAADIWATNVCVTYKF
jgi:hypothetical protein